jgi:hypothetical protein
VKKHGRVFSRFGAPPGLGGRAFFWLVFWRPGALVFGSCFRCRARCLGGAVVLPGRRLGWLWLGGVAGGARAVRGLCFFSAVAGGAAGFPFSLPRCVFFDARCGRLAWALRLRALLSFLKRFLFACGGAFFLLASRAAAVSRLRFFSWRAARWLLLVALLC